MKRFIVGLMIFGVMASASAAESKHYRSKNPPDLQNFSYKCSALVGNSSNLSVFGLIVNETAASIQLSTNLTQLNGIRKHDLPNTDSSKVYYFFQTPQDATNPSNRSLLAMLEKDFLNHKLTNENYVFQLELVWSNNLGGSDKYGCFRK